MDLFAVLLNWAKRAWIKMEFVEGKGVFKARDFRLYLLERISGSEHESLLQKLIFPPDVVSAQKEVLLSKVGQELPRHLNQLKRLLTEELIKQGLVRAEVVQERGRLNRTAAFIFLFAFVVGVAGVFFAGTAFVSPFIGVLLMGVGLGLMAAAFILWVTGYNLSILTAGGAQRFQRWQSFRDYLRRLMKSENGLLLRQEWLEDYLPYAVAFGLGDAWVKAFRNQGLSTLLGWAYTSDSVGIESTMLTAIITTSSMDSSSGGGGGAGGSGGGSSGAG